jgi:hypothetical protein
MLPGWGKCKCSRPTRQETKRFSCLEAAGGEWFWNPAARVAPGFFPAVLKRVEIGLDYLTLAGVEVRLYMAGRPASHSGHNPVADEIAGTVAPCYEERA